MPPGASIGEGGSPGGGVLETRRGWHCLSGSKGMHQGPEPVFRLSGVEIIVVLLIGSGCLKRWPKRPFCVTRSLPLPFGGYWVEHPPEASTARLRSRRLRLLGDNACQRSAILSYRCCAGPADPPGLGPSAHFRQGLPQQRRKGYRRIIAIGIPLLCH